MHKILPFLILFASIACGPKEEEEKPAKPDQGTTSDGGVAGITCLTKSFSSEVPSWISDNFDCVQVSKSGSNYVFATNDIPNHNSAYFGSSDSRYEAVPSGNSANPNFIGQQNYQMTLPASPAKASSATDTTYDAIGIATNGVVFYNNEAAPGDTLENEVVTFDNYAGHPTDIGSYHYHIEPTALTNDGSDLIGILMDGFPVFGKKCPATGAAPTDLDGNNGHEADTKISGLDTIYHYHVADLSGAYDDGVGIAVITGSYGGTPGSFTNN